MKSLFIILFCAFAFFSKAQNLVLNYSFEDTIPSTANPNCGGPEAAYPWFTPSLGSSDYWSMYYYCSGSWGLFGHQIPKTGFAYCGFSTYDKSPLPNYREYIEGIFIDTMLANHDYCISFYVSLANISKLVTDRIGAYISVDSLYDHSTNQPLSVIPQIANPIGNLIADTLNWVLISGNYTAQGGERYITIGNFYSDIATTVDSVQGGIYKMAYYYVDDVSVIDCTVGIEDIKNNKIDFTLFPIPATQFITLNINSPLNNKIDLTISDIYGKKSYTDNFNTTKNSFMQKINISNLSEGMYFVKINNGKEISVKKFIKQ
jgi:hypothetical protein